ncbi:hypothetical protein DFH06DRAFT_1310384 [Mycena polygramma]|nr:hypothetical protein DFH06DRAFT_1310384 [Mycena polygramma]
MNHTIDTTAFEEGWDFALSTMTGLCVGTLCYGILLVLWGMAAYLLYHWTRSARKILAAAALAMGMLATAQAALQIREIVVQLQFIRAGIEGELRLHLNNNLNFASDALFVTNNLVVDSLFIYRCFVVWGHNTRVVTLPILMLLTTAGINLANFGVEPANILLPALGYVDAYGDISVFYIDRRTPFVTGLATNVVLVGLTAGRIWWIRRDASVLGAAHVKRYNTVIIIILESGAMYLVGNLLWLISSLVLPRNSPSLIFFVVQFSIPQMMNIIPMLTIVRVGLGRNLGDSDGKQTERKGFSRARVAAPPQPSGLNMHVASSEVIYIGAVHDYEAGMAIPMPDLRNKVSSE